MFRHGLLVLCATFCAAAGASAQTRPLLFHAVRIFDGERVREAQDVLVANGRISAVGVGRAPGVGAETIDGAGMTLLPGLIDAHTHTSSGFVARQALVFGVTTELDMLCEPRVCGPLQAEQQRGPVTDRADVFSAMYAATAPRGHGTEYFPAPSLSSPDEAKAFVDARVAEGASWIKVILASGSPSHPLPTLDIPTIRAVVVRAHEAGKLVVVHIDTARDATAVIAAGADGLAHSFVDVDADADLSTLMKDHHAFMIPTLTVRIGNADSAFYTRMASDRELSRYLSASAKANILQGVRLRPSSYASAERTVAQLARAGVPILAGTDAPNVGNVHGASLHGELELLVRAGLSPTQALRAATAATADAFHLDDRGRIATGKRADLLLVRGDPTADIRATRAIAGIWKAGVAVDRSDFDDTRAPQRPSLRARPPVRDSIPPVVVRGTIEQRNGRPVAGVNVFLTATLDGTLTDSAGRFRITTSYRGSTDLATRRIGFLPSQSAIVVTDSGAALNMILDATAPVLSPLTVIASTYVAADERGATLSARDVVTIPGATADLGRAIQTLPGVQSVDEGNALYVRGGDQTETRIFINDVPIGVATRYENAAGTFAGTVNPFLLQSTVFMSGGFGARFGNALSGVVNLTTAGRPDHLASTVGIGLGALSGQVDLALPHRTGLRLAANRFDSDLMMRLNGSTQPYQPNPNGHDLSGSAHWDYGTSGHFKFFAIDQKNQVGIGVTDASFTGGYYSQVQSTLGVLSWSDTYAGWQISASGSRSRTTTEESAGAFTLHRSTSGGFATAHAERQLSQVAFRTGVETQLSDARFLGSIPKQSYDQGPGARTTRGNSRDVARRDAAFAEVDWRPSDPLRVSVGARTDALALARGATLDPRASITWKANELITFTGAAGIYHQFPEPLAYDAVFGTPGLPAMRARQLIGGVQIGDGTRSARFEAYEKSYSELAALNLSNTFVGGGVGRARGFDLLLRDTLPFGIDARTTLSHVATWRTDPTTGVNARAPFDIPLTSTTVLRRALGREWAAGAAIRAASGRPFTDITTATFDSVRAIWVPSYAVPFGDRMPATFRTDLQLTRTHRIGTQHLWITYLSVNNVFDRDNLFTYRYSPDYTRRFAVRSLFKRSLYVGMSFVSY